MIPAERLLAGLPLLALPAGLTGRLLSPLPGGHAVQALRAARHARRARVLAKGGAVSLQPKLVAVSLAVVACAAGGAFAVTRPHHLPAPAAIASVSPPAKPVTASPVPLATHTARLTQPTAKPASAPPATAAAASQRKGVSSWSFAGEAQALATSGASWYYNWGAAPGGVTAPGVSYVPMIWGTANVTSATLSQVSQEGHILLGFNEPDLSSQANMSVAQALDLWPRLMATGMTLGSPAVASGAATPGGWLDQFMAGAKARGYRVDFMTVHWYGGDFNTSQAVQELQSYLQAIYARYHLPIWLTEFALTSFSGGTATFPAEAQQAAFLTAATQMLDDLPYLQRYAWFSLPAAAGSGTTGLFNPGPSVTQVGQAFEAAR